MLAPLRLISNPLCCSNSGSSRTIRVFETVIKLLACPSTRVVDLSAALLFSPSGPEPDGSSRSADRSSHAWRRGDAAAPAHAGRAKLLELRTERLVHSVREVGGGDGERELNEGVRRELTLEHLHKSGV